VGNEEGDCQAYVQADEGVYIEPNFQLLEFCPASASCNPQGTSQNWQTFKKLADQLQTVRSTLNMPVNITSGYRSTACAGLCNCDVHMYGLAVDIYVAGATFTQVAQAAYNAGFVRIEVMKPSRTSYNQTMQSAGGGHVHLDIYDPNVSLYNQGLSTCICNGITSAPAYPWYAAGIEGQQPAVNYSTWSQLYSYLLAN
jgi:hypothetical protein